MSPIMFHSATVLNQMSAFLCSPNTLPNQTKTLLHTSRCFVFPQATWILPVLSSNSIQFPSVVPSVVRAAGLSVDGAPEVWRELQPLQGADGETRGAVCQLSEDRPPHGLPQRVLCSPPTAGQPEHVLSRTGVRG